MKNVYVCRGCNEAQSSYDGNLHCCSCNETFCNDSPSVTAVPKGGCEGGCNTGYGYVEEGDEEGRGGGGGRWNWACTCKCHENIKQIWKDCGDDH